MTTKFRQRVYELCRKVPKGRVTTYKAIADKLGTKAYRTVGNALRRNPYAPRVPCHRVVCSDGSLGGKMHSRKKISLLRQEGVVVKDLKIVDFEEKLHRF